MSIGIGITTRNRPHILELSLEHFVHFGTPDAQYVVVDDNSFQHKSSETIIEKFSSDLNLTYIKSPKRLGIATAKNTCLYYLSSCEDIFLFDDDAWPMGTNWAQEWVDVNRVNNVGHSMYISEAYANPNTPPFFFVAETIGEEPYLMDAWNACMGVALYFSRQCLDVLGGYDSDSCISYYGYEHAQMSIRAAQAGFTKGHRYLAPKKITEWVYSVDVTHNIDHKPIPIEGRKITEFRSSVTDHEVNSAYRNAQIMSDPQIHIPINTRLIP